MKIFSLFFVVLLLMIQGTSGESYIKLKEMQSEDCDLGVPKIIVIEIEIIEWVLVPFAQGQLVLPACWADFSTEQTPAGSIGCTGPSRFGKKGNLMIGMWPACRQTRILLSCYSPNLFLVFFGKENQDSGGFFCAGFMRAPNNDLQCKQAGGTCSTDHCPLPNTRSFGRCQEGVPCCRTVVSYRFDENEVFLRGMGLLFTFTHPVCPLDAKLP